MCGRASAICVSRRKGWRIALVSKKKSIKASAICASRRRGWRVAP
ncbi:hypothetical protein A2U01_0100463, partial [Trifolium medium]|nr:hypothetical protein [Trifolium medium]